MRHTRILAKPDAPYSLIAIGVTWFALLVFIVALTMHISTSFAGPSDWHSVLGMIDSHLAALITAVSVLVFSGVWNIEAGTRLRRNAVRGVIALLVIVNWAAWCVALWLH